MIEKLLADYDKAYGIKSYIYRYFNATGADVWDSQLGPEPGDTHIFPQMFEAHKNNQVFRLYGTDYDTEDGTCIRDYIHVCDVALAHLRACVELVDSSESRVYNLGTNTGYSNHEVTEAFKEIVGDLAIFEDERREGDPDSLIADATYFKSNGWKPEFSNIETIIRSLQDYYEKH
jgi:UDP-glucose 4-epimerase